MIDIDDNALAHFSNKEFELRKAAREGNVEIVKKCIEDKVD
jgi:hypothetical protein